MTTLENKYSLCYGEELLLTNSFNDFQSDTNNEFNVDFWDRIIDRNNACIWSRVPFLPDWAFAPPDVQLALLFKTDM